MVNDRVPFNCEVIEKGEVTSGLPQRIDKLDNDPDILSSDGASDISTEGTKQSLRDFLENSVLRCWSNIID